MWVQWKWGLFQADCLGAGCSHFLEEPGARKGRATSAVHARHTLVLSCAHLVHEMLTPSPVVVACISILRLRLFLNLGTVDILGPDHSVVGAVLCTVGCLLIAPYPSCETTDVSSHCQMSPGSKMTPS